MRNKVRLYIFTLLVFERTQIPLSVAQTEVMGAHGESVVAEPVAKNWAVFLVFFFPALGGLIFG